MAILNPYHRLAWSDGFRVLPASAVPFKASSGKLVLEYTPSSMEVRETAQIGVAALQAKPCFRFDFVSFRVGCAATHGTCDFNITGLSWDIEGQRNLTIASRTFTIQSCAAQRNCALTSISADDTAGLTNLTSVLIDVTSDGEPQNWWADDLVLDWTDGSCESATCRSQVRDIGPKRGHRQGGV